MTATSGHDPAQASEPDAEPGPAPTLAGRTVLVPRGGSRGAAWAHEVEARGGRAVLAPLVEIVGPVDDAPLRSAVAELTGGVFAWVALTSVNAVHALTALDARLGGARVAVVGEETGRAARTAGWQVDLLPERRTAAGLVEAWRDDVGPPPIDGSATGSRRVLLPLSVQAGDTLAAGLVALGWDPVRVDAYDVAPVPPGRAVVDAVAAGEIDAVIVTSGSVARRVAEVFGPLPDGVAIACIGEPSAQAARAAGLRVAVVATRSTGAGTVDALAQHYGPHRDIRTSLTTHDREDPT
ncbi:uroporphyrinogen-III synthase [Serinibacter arcticus]|uniref:Uroporphyrinogen-III synthase n=1 Tax=Serinibacter arcticus TaxID=1655435 RepID=A0A4Z1E1U6_9MICO|nr:uroporphyrinogen-III synthase [Serinibacter arcticus]TGO04642.1 Uroporphyrinogen-III methyltransferase [Serinibacter arcticus]